MNYVAKPGTVAADRLRRVSDIVKYSMTVVTLITVIFVAVMASDATRNIFESVEMHYGARAYAVCSLLLILIAVEVVVSLSVALSRGVIYLCIRKEIKKLTIFPINKRLVQACRRNARLVTGKKLPRRVDAGALYQWHRGELDWIERNNPPQS